MKIPSVNAPAATGRRAGVIGPVTRAMVYARTRELALGAGRRSFAVSQQDYEQARRELTGESDCARQDAILDAPA